MTVAAFLYDNYYCWSPKQSFAGIFATKEIAKESVKGGRWENQNLETFDLQTYEFNRYAWDPIYEHKEDRETKKQYFKLKYKNGGNAPEPEWVEAEMRSCNSDKLSLESQAKFDAGYWR